MATQEKQTEAREAVSLCVSERKQERKTVSHLPGEEHRLHNKGSSRRGRTYTGKKEQEPPPDPDFVCDYTKYHVCCTAVCYVCQSQCVYMTALWLRSLILNSLKDHWRVPM